ncbi:MAG: hypothetical protein WBX15_08685 [Thermoanaerobaculia bacterium]
MHRLTIPALVLLLLVPAGADAIDTGPVRGSHVAITATPDINATGVDPEARRLMPRYLAEELERGGYHVRIADATAADLLGRAERPDEFLIEILYTEADGHPIGDISTGGIIGGETGVGAEVALISARAAAKLVLYDGYSGRQVDSFVVKGSAVQPALAGLGIGGRHGGFFLSLPIFSQAPYRSALRDLAREAVKEIAAHGAAAGLERKGEPQR